MFNSGKSANELINEVLNETDIAISVTKQVIADELDAFERKLYSEIIKEQAEETVCVEPEIDVDDNLIPDDSFDL